MQCVIKKLNIPNATAFHFFNSKDKERWFLFCITSSWCVASQNKTIYLHKLSQYSGHFFFMFTKKKHTHISIMNWTFIFRNRERKKVGISTLRKMVTSWNTTELISMHSALLKAVNHYLKQLKLIHLVFSHKYATIGCKQRGSLQDTSTTQIDTNHFTSCLVLSIDFKR